MFTWMTWFSSKDHFMSTWKIVKETVKDSERAMCWSRGNYNERQTCWDTWQENSIFLCLGNISPPISSKTMLIFLFLRQCRSHHLHHIKLGGMGIRELTLEANKAEQVLQYRKCHFLKMSQLLFSQSRNELFSSQTRNQDTISSNYFKTLSKSREIRTKK